MRNIRAVVLRELKLRVSGKTGKLSHMRMLELLALAYKLKVIN